jgi:hypothetical protein
MQMVKIQIPDRAESARAMIEMSRRGRIDCYADDVYLVPEAMLGILNGMGVTYQEIGRGGPDYAEKTRGTGGFLPLAGVGGKLLPGRM